MSPDLPILPAPPRADRGEMFRIALNLTLFSALAAAILGGVWLATERYAAAARLAGEKRAIGELLGLGESAEVTEVEQFMAAAAREVVYRAHAYGDDAGPVRTVTFSFEGELRGREDLAAPAAAPAGEGAEAALEPLGRMFVARQDGALAGFVVEGEARGYKNRIRFFVALDSAFQVAGVRVLEHEEDPGLGAEIATPWFEGQYIGRSAGDVAKLTVTKDPMPEDWRAALAGLARTPVADWRAKHGALLAREGPKPIYAVTGATISSKAVTDGVKATVDHFRRRWQLLAPYLEDRP